MDSEQPFALFQIPPPCSLTPNPLCPTAQSQTPRPTGGHSSRRPVTVGIPRLVLPTYAGYVTPLEASRNALRAPCIALLASLLVLGTAATCLGDQLQWNPLSVCRAAAKRISRPSLLVSFCSQADRDHVELWSVSDLELAVTSVRGLYELIVSGTKLCRSDYAYSSDEFPVPEEQWTFHRGNDAEGFSVGVDLAYLYIHIGGGSFRCLAQVLGLDCVVGVEIVHLPHAVLEYVVASSQAKRQTGPWSPGQAPE